MLMKGSRRSGYDFSLIQEERTIGIHRKKTYFLQASHLTLALTDLATGPLAQHMPPQAYSVNAIEKI
jgi:hypothetical protein